jgi:uncharacterized membrane protein
VEQGIKLVVSGGILAPPGSLAVDDTDALLRESETPEREQGQEKEQPEDRG